MKQRRWFEYGLEENKLESGADEWIGWEEAPPIWGCECAGLWGFVGAPGFEGFVGCAADVVSTMGLWVRRTLRVVGCAADVVSTIWGFCLERQQRANEVGRWRSKREKGERLNRRRGWKRAWEWFNFLFIYKTCLIDNQKSLKLHKRTRSKP